MPITHDNLTNLTMRLRANSPFPARLIEEQSFLDNIYRDSWIAAAIIDAVATDMTTSGFEFDTDTTSLDTDTADNFTRWLDQHGIIDALTNSIKWSRLYGGAALYIDVTGQDPATSLDPRTIAWQQVDRFKVFTRWTAYYQKHAGMWQLMPDNGAIMMAHPSRVIPFFGTRLPPLLEEQNQGWGDSVLHRIFGRIELRDNALFAAGKLVNKCFLRTVKIQDLRQVLSIGGKAQENLEKMFGLMRDIQDSSGLTLLDGSDEFQTDSYQFSGLSDLLAAFDTDVAGACGIPMTRLYGVSPQGFSTGDSDLQSYYDRIASKQESDLRQPLTRIFAVCWPACFGTALPPDFTFSFKSLWRPKDIENRSTAVQEVGAVVNAANAGILTPAQALRALKATGKMFADLPVEDIEAAGLLGAKLPDLSALDLASVQLAPEELKQVQAAGEQGQSGMAP